jgi:hypothetical protein
MGSLRVTVCLQGRPRPLAAALRLPAGTRPLTCTWYNWYRTGIRLPWRRRTGIRQVQDRHPAQVQDRHPAQVQDRHPAPLATLSPGPGRVDGPAAPGPAAATPLATPASPRRHGVVPVQGAGRGAECGPGRSAAEPRTPRRTGLPYSGAGPESEPAPPVRVQRLPDHLASSRLCPRHGVWPGPGPGRCRRDRDTRDVTRWT